MHVLCSDSSLQPPSLKVCDDRRCEGLLRRVGLENNWTSGGIIPAASAEEPREQLHQVLLDLMHKLITLEELVDFILKLQPGSLVAWYKLLQACAGLQNGALDYMVGWIRGGPEMRAFQALNFRNRCQQMALPGRQPRTSEALCRCSIDVLPWVVVCYRPP